MPTTGQEGVFALVLSVVSTILISWNSKIAPSVRLSRSTQKIDGCERFILQVSVADHVNSSRVLQVSVKNGSSSNAMIHSLQLTIEKHYTPHPRTDEFPLDIGCLVKAIGGPKLLFALNRSLSLPSYRTIGRHRIIPQLFPSILARHTGTPSGTLRRFFAKRSGLHQPLSDIHFLSTMWRWMKSASTCAPQGKKTLRPWTLH